MYPIPTYPTQNRASPAQWVAAITLTTLLGACGGGGSSGTTAALVGTTPVVSTSISGAVVKGNVSGAQVCAFGISGTGKGAALGSCTTTAANGSYTLTVPVSLGAVWLEAAGGSYIDEVTALATSLPAGSPLTSLATANGAATIAMLTPLTTLALNTARQNLGATGALNAAAFEAAAAQWLSALGLPATLNINTTLPSFGTGANDYGTALLNISKIIANGLSLAQLLATTQPAALQAAYALVAKPTAPVVVTPPSDLPAPLVISAATPSSWNGSLSTSAVQYEHGSSDETATAFQSTQPFCRVAIYGLVSGGDGKRYFLEIPFRKDTKALGLVKFGDDAGFATLARVLQPSAGVSIDTTRRRITFTNLVIGNSAQGLTLNGAFDYPTNVAPENRANCG